MTDITAASAVSAAFRQASVNTSHESYSAARTGHTRPDTHTENTSASAFSSDGSFLGSDTSARNTSPLKQVVNFLA
ncbi:hypothetical protein AA0323_2603 [Asaia siamensis NRIC 0323]|nr:hypothetical protein AA0323_2603 [Asaia siamensis NRIC 0323]